MSKARQLADLGNVYDDGALSNRNLIINGAMQVAQRGTSFSAGDGYTLDRFVCVNHTSASQSSSCPSGFINSLEVTGTNVLVRQPIENSHFRLSANSFTVSFYIKGNAAYSGTVDINDGTQQSFSITTTWQRIVKTFDALTSPSAVYGNNNDYLDIQVSDTSATWQITGVQLEVGDLSTATPFEHRSYGDELARCQRYYYKTYNDSTAPSTATNVGIVSSTLSQSFQNTGYIELYNVPYAVKMRASPTITVYDTSGNSGKCNYYQSATLVVNNTITSHAMSENGFAVYSDNVTSKGGIGFHFTADAEL
jgi:hypothetical protein